MKWSNSHQADDSGTVRVCNNRSLPIPPLEPNVTHGLRIHLWYDKWDPRIHPKGGAVIHHDCSLLHRHGPQFSTNTTSRTEQGYINPIKALWHELLYSVVLPLERDLLPGGSTTCEELEGAVRKVALGENLEKLLTDGAGDSDYSDGGAVFTESHADSGGARWRGVAASGERRRWRKEVVASVGH